MLVTELTGFVGEHPQRERSRCQLMAALARSGHQAAALQGEAVLQSGGAPQGETALWSEAAPQGFAEWDICDADSIVHLGTTGH
jgi:hypothetical protein